MRLLKQMRFKFTLFADDEMKHAVPKPAKSFLIELENREKQLVRDTGINNCQANRRECLFLKGKLLFFEGGQPTFRVARNSYFSIYFTFQRELECYTIFCVETI